MVPLARVQIWWFKPLLKVSAAALFFKMKTDLVVGGFIFHEDKVLLIHHKKSDKWWEVGGHIDKDETPDDCLLREIKEEVNIDVQILNQANLTNKGTTKRNLAAPFYVSVHNVGDHDHCCLFYICKALNPEKLKINKELKNFGWFTKDDMNKDHIPPDVKDIAAKAFELWEKHNA